MRFTAHAVGLDESEEDNYFAVVLADDGAEPVHLLELAIALHWDDQDRDLGLATYSVTIDAAATAYGGVQRCVLTSNELVLHLSNETSRHLGIDEEIRVDLSFAPRQRDSLAAALRRIFDPDLPQAPVLVIRHA